MRLYLTDSASTSHRVVPPVERISRRSAISRPRAVYSRHAAVCVATDVAYSHFSLRNGQYPSFKVLIVGITVGFHEENPHSWLRQSLQAKSSWNNSRVSRRELHTRGYGNHYKRKGHGPQRTTEFMRCEVENEIVWAMVC